MRRSAPRDPPVSRADAMETLSFSSLREDLLDGERLPLSGVFELTFHCNLHCPFCYLGRLRQGDRHLELSTAEVCDILAQIAAAGCLNLVLTGGEPLMRKDFPAIYRTLAGLGVVPTLFTNATLVDDALADLLAEHRPRRVEVTLYGATAETFDRVVAQPGAHAACMRGLDRLLARGLTVELKTTLTRDNAAELPALRAFAASKGLRYRYDPMLDPCLDGDLAPLSHRLDPEAILAIDLQDPGRFADLERLAARPTQVDDPDRVYVCGAGESSFHIDARGRLSMCGLTRYAAFDLREGAFATGFHQHFAALRASHYPPGQVPRCRGCDLIALCSNCPGTAYVEHGDTTRPSQFHCTVAHLRAEAVRRRATRQGATASDRSAGVSAESAPGRG